MPSKTWRASVSTAEKSNRLEKHVLLINCSFIQICFNKYDRILTLENMINCKPTFIHIYIYCYIYWCRFINICQQMYSTTCGQKMPTYKNIPTSRGLTYCGRDKMGTILQTTFSNAFSWMKIYEIRLRFHWSSFPRVQLTISQHWFR